MAKAGSIRKQIWAKLTGRSVEEADRLFYQKATWESWKNQDRCLIGTKTDYSLFEKTDMHIWHGINSTVEKKLAKDMERVRATGHPFTYKVFTDLGNGGLAGEHIPRFADEVRSAQAHSLVAGGEK